MFILLTRETGMYRVSLKQAGAGVGRVGVDRVEVV